MRTGDGGGWRPVTGDTYQIKTMAVTSTPVGGMSASEIESLFSQLDPSAVAEAGQAHTAAAKTLQSIADSLVTHAQALAGGWSGTAAQASIAAFGQLHQTAVRLAQAAAQTGQVLTWLGETILPYYKNWKAPSNGVVGTIESWFGSNPQDKAAQQVMQRLNDRLSQANAGLPASVSITLPKIGQAGHAPATTGGIQPGGGSGAATAGVSLTSAVRGTVSTVGGGGGVAGLHPGDVGVSGHGPGPGSGLGVVPPPGGSTPPATHLAGLPPAGGAPSGVASVPGGPGGVPGGGGLPGGPGGVPGGPEPFGPLPMPGQGGVDAPGPGAVGTFPGEPGLSGEPGAGTVRGSGPGGQGLAGEDVGFSSDGSAVMGSDGMIGTGPGMAEGDFGPGGSGATGFVGADEAAAEPGGGLPVTGGGSGGGRRENERYRQAWMPEDADIWEGGSATVSSGSTTLRSG